MAKLLLKLFVLPSVSDVFFHLLLFFLGGGTEKSLTEYHVFLTDAFELNFIYSEKDIEFSKSCRGVTGRI